MRIVHFWNACEGVICPSKLRLEKILSFKNKYHPDKTHNELIFSTTDPADLEILQNTDCLNLLLIGHTNQTMLNVALVSAIAYRKRKGDYLFTLSCEEYMVD